MAAGTLVVDYVQASSNTLTIQSSSGSTIISANTNGVYNNSGNLTIPASGGSTFDSNNRMWVGGTTLPAGTIGMVNLIGTTYAPLSCYVGTSNTNTQVYFNSPSGTIGSISTSNSTTTYATSSDYRLKDNIQPMTGALGVVEQLKPCTYTWKSNGLYGQGFIAHELQEVVPDCVTGTKDAVDSDGNPVYQGIDTSFLVATLVAAIQEQQVVINQQSADITALKLKVGI
jgi:hypothetical protein